MPLDSLGYLSPTSYGEKDILFHRPTHTEQEQANSAQSVRARRAPDLSKPSLEGLAWLMRQPLVNWEWDFSIISSGSKCGTAGCALGYARQYWKIETPRPYIDSTAAVLGMENPSEDSAVGAIFAAGWASSEVTPAVVAGRIDDFLAGRPIRYLIAGDRSAAEQRA